MNDRFNIAVLGPIPRDHITTYEGDVVEKYGCAVYTTVGISALAGPGSRIVPVSHVRKVDRPKICNLLSDFPHVELDHITDDADMGDVISLYYHDQNHRSERQTGYMNPLTVEDVADLADFDAFVFVPVTDFEIALETLRFCKEQERSRSSTRTDRPISARVRASAFCACGSIATCGCPTSTS